MQKTFFVLIILLFCSLALGSIPDTLAEKRSGTLTSTKDLGYGHEEHQLALLLPPINGTYTGVVYYYATENLQHVTLIGPLDSSQAVGKTIWTADGITKYQYNVEQAYNVAGQWKFSGNAIAFHTTRTQPFTVSYTVDYSINATVPKIQQDNDDAQINITDVLPTAKPKPTIKETDMEAPPIPPSKTTVSSMTMAQQLKQIEEEKKVLQTELQVIDNKISTIESKIDKINDLIVSLKLDLLRSLMVILEDDDVDVVTIQKIRTIVDDWFDQKLLEITK